MHRWFLASPWWVVVLSCGGTTPESSPEPVMAPDAGVDPPEPEYADPFSLDVLSDARIGSDPDAESYQRAAAGFDLGPGPFAEVTLVLELGTTCFPFDTWAANPPPPGERWPADCDAFDRVFQVTLDAPFGEPNALEVMRGATPFGGPMQAEVDLTDLANAGASSRELHAYISTHSDSAGQVTGSNGGWNVTARLDVVPGPAPRDVLAAIALVSHRHLVDTVPEPMELELPDGTTSARLDYRVTGHGGGTDPSTDCIGPAEEFCARTHHLYIDGTELADVVPWRDDCAELCTVTTWDDGRNRFDYCAENPAGAIASVGAPRAGWCPGAVSEPHGWTMALEPGAHTFRYAIDDVADRGRWRVSATLFAYGD